MLTMIAVMFVLAMFGLFYIFFIPSKKDMDTRSNSQCVLDGIPRQKSRSWYLVEYYRRHKDVSIEILQGIENVEHELHGKMVSNPTIENQLAYRRIVRDRDNAWAYYEKYEEERNENG